MSWIISGIGKAPALAAKLATDIATYKCAEPEESIKLEAGTLIQSALAAQDPSIVVQVQASGSQSGGVNSLSINIQPVHGFVE